MPLPSSAHCMFLTSTHNNHRAHVLIKRYAYRLEVEPDQHYLGFSCNGGCRMAKYVRVPKPPLISRYVVKMTSSQGNSLCEFYSVLTYCKQLCYSDDACHQRYCTDKCRQSMWMYHKEFCMQVAAAHAAPAAPTAAPPAPPAPASSLADSVTAAFASSRHCSHAGESTDGGDNDGSNKLQFAASAAPPLTSSSTASSSAVGTPPSSPSSPASPATPQSPATGWDLSASASTAWEQDLQKISSCAQLPEKEYDTFLEHAREIMKISEGGEWLHNATERRAMRRIIEVAPHMLVPNLVCVAIRARAGGFFFSLSLVRVRSPPPPLFDDLLLLKLPPPHTLLTTFKLPTTYSQRHGAVPIVPF